MLNFNPAYNFKSYLNKNIVIFDVNNQSNFIIKPEIESYQDILNIFSNLIGLYVNSIEIPLTNLKEKQVDYIKKRLVFDIQSSANEKSVEILLKNLHQHPDIEIYLIWRTGSIDFDYTHIDTDNFLTYYRAAANAFLFFTDDRNMLELLLKLKLNPIFLGKSTNKNIVSFNPKDIFNIKNYIFSLNNE